MKIRDVIEIILFYRIEELTCELHAKVEHSRNLEKQCDELTMKVSENIVFSH